MKHTFLAPCLAAAAVLASGAAAQISYEPSIGTPQGAGDDTITAGLPLGFNFAFPDGTVVTAVDVDSNGRILIPGTDTSDFSESVSELLAQASSICPLWDDMNMGAAAADDVYFNALPGKAVITFKDAVFFGGSTPFTFQVQLFADNRIGIVYDPRVPNDEPLVAVSAGNGAADPGGSDLSGGVASAGVPNIYQDFNFDFDLAGSTLEFVPDGTGGYNVAYVALPFASVTAGRSGCLSDFALTITPDGTGGYNVAPGGAFDPNFATGTALGLTDDSLSGALALGFSFPAPGGVATTDIEVDSNGRVIQVGTDASDFSESVSELLNNLGWSICPLWTDMNPSAAASAGDVYFLAGANEASVTWDRVVQFGQSTPITYQVRLFADGSMQFVYRNGFLYTQTNTIVGVSAGNGIADPGEVDLTAGASSNGVAVVYEFFDIVNGDVFDLGAGAAPPVLDALTLPVVGTSLDLDISSDPAGTLAHFFMVGVAVNLDLSTLGIGLDGCFQLSDGLILTTTSPIGTPLSISLPNDPNLVGLVVECQGVTVSPGFNAFGLAFTDSKVATLGL
jgi:hypothetical protein